MKLKDHQIFMTNLISDLTRAENNNRELTRQVAVLGLSNSTNELVKTLLNQSDLLHEIKLTINKLRVD